MSIIKCAPYTVRAEQDDYGHRNYWVTYLVQSSAPYQNGSGDGPRTAGLAAALPDIGDPYIFGNDSDPWALCHPNRSIKPQGQLSGDPIKTYTVEVLFSTRPMKRCMTMEWGDPLSEPQKVSGTFVKHTIEAAKDRNGVLIKNSAHEPLRGPKLEFDSSRPTVRVEQNVSTLQLDLCSSLMDHVNDDVMWGLAARHVKLSNFTWEELWYGTCTAYYKRVFDFDLRNNDQDPFDPDIVDEGTKVLNGRWIRRDDATPTSTEPGCDQVDLWKTIDICGAAPDPSNPQHFIRYKDLNGENTRVILNGAGKPAYTSEIVNWYPTAGYGTAVTGDMGVWKVEYYPEANLFQLGIPTDIDFGTATPD
jgi:hypothetical protein